MKKNYYNGIGVGLLIGTIIWFVFWLLVIDRIEKVHKQELDYIIEKHYQIEENN